MYNYNGEIAEDFKISVTNNRAFLYGDAVFETIKVSDGKILFLEDHYFRLMASMRILRMEIPMEFTMEFFEEQIFALLTACNSSIAFRVRITVFREGEGTYVPNSKEVSFLISAQKLQHKFYPNFDGNTYEVELFKDFSINAQLLSTLKSTNRMVQITAGIFANENGYQNCLLLNSNKNVAEAIDSNIFMVNGNVIITPPIADGCLNGIMRKELIRLLEKQPDYVLEVRSISSFDLQKADELFLTNAIKGIQPITKFRKKNFETKVSQHILKLLNNNLI